MLHVNYESAIAEKIFMLFLINKGILHLNNLHCIRQRAYMLVNEDEKKQRI